MTQVELLTQIISELEVIQVLLASILGLIAGISLVRALSK